MIVQQFKPTIGVSWKLGWITFFKSKDSLGMKKSNQKLLLRCSKKFYLAPNQLHRESLNSLSKKSNLRTQPSQRIQNSQEPLKLMNHRWIRTIRWMMWMTCGTTTFTTICQKWVILSSIKKHLSSQMFLTSQQNSPCFLTIRLKCCPAAKFNLPVPTNSPIKLIYSLLCVWFGSQLKFVTRHLCFKKEKLQLLPYFNVTMPCAWNIA